MKTFNNAKLRIQVDVASFDNPIDAIHNTLPQYWRGNDLRIELGIFSDNDVIDVSNLASVTFEIRALNNDGEAPAANMPILLSQKCSSLDSLVTVESWNNGSKQHAIFNFSANETNLLPGAYWVSIWALTTDDVAKILTLGAGLIHVLENGGGISTTPPEPITKYYTAEESDNRFISTEKIDIDSNLGTSNDKVPSQAAVKTYVDLKSGIGEVNTASNIGSSVGIFKEKIGVNLAFKSLKAGSNVTITASDDEVTIASTGGGSGAGGHMIQHNGTMMTNRANLNFTGLLNVTDSDSATNVSVDTATLLNAKNNLSDVADLTTALSNLGGVQSTRTINNKSLVNDIILTTDEIPQGTDNKYNVQSDWSANTGEAAILNKPVLSRVATTGNYTDLSNKPTLSTVAITGKYNDLTESPILGTIASQDANTVTITGGSIAGITDLAVSDGGTGASTAQQARTNLGLGSVATENILPISKGGTGLSQIGSSGQTMQVNTSGTALEWVTSSGGGMNNPMTTKNDIIIGGSSGVPMRLAVPSTSSQYILKTTGGSSSEVTWQEAAYVIDSYSNGTNWYRKWSDGWIEQGGTRVASSYVQEVSLLLAYSNTNYSIFTTRIMDGYTGSAASEAPVAAKTTTTFSFNAPSLDTSYNKIFWRAMGY